MKKIKHGAFCPLSTLFLISVLVIFVSCKKDKPDSPSAPVTPTGKASRIFILNEGNFGAGNSSLSLYSSDTDQLIEDYYSTQNNQPMGDVGQSMAKINGKFYIVVNNSAKILVCDSLLKKTAEISSLSSPRYILQVTNSKAYVSDLFANGIHIVDLNSNTKSGVIGLPGWTEQMVVQNNKVFVTNPNRNYTYLIDVGTDKVSDSVFVGPNASSCVLDKNGNVWVLSAGDPSNSVLARLNKINPNTVAVEYVLLAGSNFPGYLCANGKKDTLYFINSDIYRVSAITGPIDPKLVVSKGTRSFYGLGVSPRNYRLFVSDAIDYAQRSNIYVYDANGTERKVLKAGINSNSFYFE